MIRSITLLKLRPGVDPEETWKYWREKHISWARERLHPEARKYIIARVVHRIGEDDIYGLAEVWFDNMEDAVKTMERLAHTEPDELLGKRVIPTRIVLEEEEIPLREAHPKW